MESTAAADSPQTVAPPDVPAALCGERFMRIPLLTCNLDPHPTHRRHERRDPSGRLLHSWAHGFGEPLTERWWESGPEAARPLTVDDLICWGEDGEYIAAPGHVDKDRFTELADEFARQNDPDLALGELPSVTEQAQHTWWRPIDVAWFQDHPEQVLGMTVIAIERKARALADEGCVVPCTGEHPAAQAWTLIGTGE